MELAQKKTARDDVPPDLQEALTDLETAGWVKVKAESMPDPRRLHITKEGALHWCLGAGPITGTLTETASEQYVTRDQVASLVKRNKDTVADWFNDDPQAPQPAIEGGGGKRHEYLWREAQPWLQKKTGRLLPQKFPDLGPC
jgi:hypothetical protein